MNDEGLSTGVALIGDHLAGIARALDYKGSSDFAYLQRRLKKLDSSVARRLSEAMAVLADDQDRRDADENWRQILVAVGATKDTSRPRGFRRLFG